MVDILIYLTWLLAAPFIVGPVVVGAYALLFSRRFSLQMYQWRKAVWRFDYSEADLKFGRVSSMTIGAALLIAGLAVAIQLVARLW